MSSVMVAHTMPNVQQDANDLHRAFRGFGCDEKKIIHILGHRSFVQRHELRDVYKRIYSEDLLHRLKSELRGNLERAVLLWMHDPAERDAIIIREALKGFGTNDRALTEVVCSRTWSQLQAIRQAYSVLFGRSLEEDIAADTSGHYKKLLMAYLLQPRSETLEVDMYLAQADAREFFKAGEGRIGTDEGAIIHLLTTRSAAHLNAAFNFYEQYHGHSIEKAMKRETSGDFQNALRAVVKCIHYPAKYFAKVLYMSMKGFGTDDRTLIRVVVTRAEIDMQYIKAEFVRKYKKSLEHMISSDTSGNYKTFLLTLIGSRPDHV